MTDELWNEVRDIVQETGIKIIPMEKKCKTKWLSGEVLQIAVKRREAKSKGEKERCKHLNAEFQRIARRDKKGFFSDQCKEIEEKVWKRSIFIPIPKKGNAKECSNYRTIVLISHASKVTLKFSKPGFSNT